MLYQVISIDSPSFFEGFRTATPSGEVVDLSQLVQYRKFLDTQRLPIHKMPFLPVGSCHAEIADVYRDIAKQAHVSVDLGEVEFHSISATGFDGLLFDDRYGIVFIGNMIGWSREYFDWWIENSNVGFKRWISSDSFEAEFGPPVAHFDDCIYLKSPGYNIFGHWLLDTVPRLQMLRYMRSVNGANVVIPKVTPWIETILRLMGIERHRSSPCETISLRRARFPTFTKNGFMLGEPITGLGWRNLVAQFNHDNIHSHRKNSEFIYVSRKKWAENTSDYNQVFIEDVFIELGFEIIHPEIYDLHTQAAIFSAARCIIGEDGSALHNIIFSQPGAVLGVINTRNRVNYWHAGICHLMGHRLAHIDAISESGIVDFAELRSFVVKLVAAVRD